MGSEAQHCSLCSLSHLYLRKCVINLGRGGHFRLLRPGQNPVPFGNLCWSLWCCNNPCAPPAVSPGLYQELLGEAAARDVTADVSK